MIEIPKDRSLTFSEKIEFIRQTSMGVPKKIEIDLAVPINDQLYNIAGNVFYVFSAPLEADNVGVKVNETREPMINYAVHCGLITPFYRLYITTPAGQTGTMTIIYGTEAPDLMEILDHRSTTIADFAAILNQLQGDTGYEDYFGQTIGVVAAVVLEINSDRKGCWIDALSTNTDSIFLGFSNAVTAGGAPGTWFKELLPGTGWGIDDYRGAIYARAAVAGQILGAGEW